MEASRTLPTIAVALCTHNGARFIREQLESILAQDYLPTLIVISDDDSRDDTLAIAESTFSSITSQRRATSTQLIVLRNVPALGVAANFQQAIQACTGELVALCDQDDVWMPGRLRAIAEVFAARPELTLLHGDAVLIDSQGRPLGHTLLHALGTRPAEIREISHGNARDVFIRRNLATGATTVFRRRLADIALPIPVGWIHDEWLAMTASLTGVVDIDLRQLVGYRQHDQNQIGATAINFATRLERLRQPRTARNARLLSRAGELVSRLEGGGILGQLGGAKSLHLAQRKLRHEAFRSALPGSRLKRIIPVLNVAVQGGYSRFGLGMQDVLRDLVQPI